MYPYINVLRHLIKHLCVTLGLPWAIHLATIAHKEGKNTSPCLLDEGVYLAKEGIITHVRAATGDGADG